MGIGVTNLIFTFVGLWLIDRLGRRTLLYIGSFGYILSLGARGLGVLHRALRIVPACIFAFIAAHAVGQGAVIWVFISEIFPNRHRAEGQALGSFTHWIFAALLTTFFPKMVTAFAPGYVFLFFCGMMVLQLLWVKTHGAGDQGRAARADAAAARHRPGAGMTLSGGPAAGVTRQPALASAGLAVLAALAAALAFWPVLANGFVSYDDPVYVLDNAAVRRGLQLEGVRWAFSTFHADNWHPLTWLSHMLDVSLFGLAPAGHHATSLALHAAAAAACVRVPALR